MKLHGSPRLVNIKTPHPQRKGRCPSLIPGGAGQIISCHLDHIAVLAHLSDSDSTKEEGKLWQTKFLDVLGS